MRVEPRKWDWWPYKKGPQRALLPSFCHVRNNEKVAVCSPEESSHQNCTTLAPWCQISSLQNCGKYSSVVLRHPASGTLLHQPELSQCPLPISIPFNLKCPAHCFYSFPEIFLEPLTCSDLFLLYFWADMMHAYNSLDSLLLLINVSCLFILFLQLYCNIEGKIVFLSPSLSHFLSPSLPSFYLFSLFCGLLSVFRRVYFVQNRGSGGSVILILAHILVSVGWWFNCLPSRFISFTKFS